MNKYLCKYISHLFIVQSNCTESWMPYFFSDQNSHYDFTNFRIPIRRLLVWLSRVANALSWGFFRENATGLKSRFRWRLKIFLKPLWVLKTSLLPSASLDRILIGEYDWTVLNFEKAFSRNYQTATELRISIFAKMSHFFDSFKLLIAKKNFEFCKRS